MLIDGDKCECKNIYIYLYIPARIWIVCDFSSTALDLTAIPTLKLYSTLIFVSYLLTIRIRIFRSKYYKVLLIFDIFCGSTYNFFHVIISKFQYS